MPSPQNSLLRPCLTVALRWIGPLTLDQACQVCRHAGKNPRPSRTKSVLTEMRIDGLIKKSGDVYLPK